MLSDNHLTDHLVDMFPHPFKYPREIPSAPAWAGISVFYFRRLHDLVKLFRRFGPIVVSSLVLTSSCALQKSTQPSTGTHAESPASDATTDDSQIVQAEQSHAINVELTGRARVIKLLQDDTVPPRHQKFLIELSNGSTVLVAHNIDEGERVPLDDGSSIVIHGIYIWKPKGGVIHWTHHSTSLRHEGGWIEYAGKRYQ